MDRNNKLVTAIFLIMVFASGLNAYLHYVKNQDFIYFTNENEIPDWNSLLRSFLGI